MENHYEKIKDSNGREYKKLPNGTCYNIDTPDNIIVILETAKDIDDRLVFDFGDTKTGKSWGEIHDTTGYVGRSTGVIKIPLLIYNKRCYGGGAILTGCIVRIQRSKGKKTLYEHPNYHTE